MTDSSSPEGKSERRWQPLSALERRIVGVLVEKAKTTPDAYPLSLNGLVVGANQKSNRYPLMQIEADDLTPAIDRLRSLGAMAEVMGGGRVSKYRHYLYEWLGVDKVEMAVMVELLLRGAQTEGELRGRASRMEPIADLPALRTVLDSLRAKGLVVSLTSPGRGHVVSHNLYEPRELERLRTQFAAGQVPSAADDAADESPALPASAAQSQGSLGHAAAPRSTSPPPSGTSAAGQALGGTSTSAVGEGAAVQQLRTELALLRTEVTQLRGELAEALTRLNDCAAEVERLKAAWGA